jgi:cyanophycin synthetase
MVRQGSGEKIYSVLTEFLNAAGQSSNYLSLTELPELQDMELPELHVWLFRALSEALDMLPDTTRLTARDASSYQVLVSWKVVEGITLGLMSFTLGFIANVARLCQSNSVHLLDNLNLPEKLDEFSLRKHGVSPDISTQIVIDECLRRDIPVLRFMNNNRCVQLGYGRERVQILESASSKVNLIAHKLSVSKVASTGLMRQYGIPAPESTSVGDADQAAEVAERIGYPVVVKPNGAGQGVGVTVGVQNKEELGSAFRLANKHGSGVLVETQLPGVDHRVMVIDYKMVAVARRVPAAVEGNGHNTVAELIEIENRNPDRGLGFDKPMSRIPVTDEVRSMLAEQNLTLESVAEAGLNVQLNPTPNLLTGGSSEDETSIIHPDNQRAAERAARLFGVKVTGVDFVSPDISQSYLQVGGGICELNTGPSLRVHDIGKDESCVAGPLVDSYFGQKDGRIPIGLVFGDKNSAEIVQLLTEILENAGLVMGSATRNGLRISAEQYSSANCTNVNSFRQILIDPLVEVALFEADAKRITQQGLVMDRSTVSAVVSVAAGRTSAASTVSISPEAVVARNASFLTVLNAEDPNVMALGDQARSEQICYVYTGKAGRVESGLFCVFSEGRVQLSRGEESILEISEGELTAQGSGRLPQNIAYAIPLAWGMGVAPDTIKAAILQRAK